MPAVVAVGPDGAQSVGDIVRGLPACCQGFVSKLFTETHAAASKMYAADHAMNEFRRFKAENKIPTSINSVKTPTLQCSSEYLNDSAANEFKQIEKDVRTFKKNLLDQFVKAKTEERTYFFNTYISTRAQTDNLKDPLKKCLADMFVRHGVKSQMELPSAEQEEYAKAELESSASLQKIVTLAHNQQLLRLQRNQEKRDKKSAVEKKATGPNSKGKEETLEKQVESVLKRREQSRRDKKKAGQKGTSIDSPLSSLSERELFLTANRQNHETARVPETKRQGIKRKIIEEAVSVEAVRSKRFRVEILDTYPERFFEVSLAAQELWFLMHCRVSSLNTLRILNYDVHKADGVILPRHIELSLAMNLKYLFPSNLVPSLAVDSWAHATGRLRQEEHFREQEADARLPPYLDKVRVKQVFGKKGSDALEAGLMTGRRALRKELGQLVPPVMDLRDPPREFSELQCRPQDLQRFMLLNRYMAFITDKNLGVSVVEKEWYSTGVRKFLSADTFMPVTGTHVEQSWEWLEEKLKQLSESEDERGCRNPLPKNFLAFIRWTDSESPKELPQFHMIPKVHKNPWKLRPIVPMHKYATTRLAMVVQHYLHPLLNKFPWICESSQRFVHDLLVFNRDKGVYMPRMFTGDVVSMYTNIKTDLLIAALRGWMREQSGFSKDLIAWLCESVRFLNEAVFFQFGSQRFWQQEGVAMGLACAPTLANLFMGIWEERIGVTKLFLFYRRYIDDVYAITKGEDYTDLVQIPGLEMTWESAESIPFLDCEVHLHDREICVKPFTKPMSHYQYIPWKSSHPLHVKRGLVKGELLRYSSLSAQKAYFDERKKRLHMHLSARGWPERALKAWMTQVQWRDPLRRSVPRNRERSERTLFAKSKYNPVWEQVSLQPVWDAFIEEMAHWPGQPDLPTFDGLTMSLQRSPSLWDALRRLNRISLAD